MTFPLPFSSLRNNLIAAFAAVILLSLLLASGAFAYLLRDYQADREKDRLEGATFRITSQVVRATRAGLSPSQIEDAVDQSASADGLRVMLLDERGVVFHDSDADSWVGQEFPIPPTSGRRPNVYEGTLPGPSGERVFTVVVVPPGQQNPATPMQAPVAPPPSSPVRVAIVAPEQTLTNAWPEVLPRLSLAAGGAMLVSTAIAWWLASKITRPVVQITRATEEMARGNYAPDLELPETSDEIGLLSKAFITMAREVARSHRAMRDLLANVSHDLRTPLTSVQGFAGALVDGTLAGPEGAREAGRIIGEEAERMRRLVEDLLYLGRIESGEITLDREPIDLADVARAAQSRFTFRAQETETHLRILADDLVPMIGDPHRLAQVLDNLLDNAFKHTPPGGTVTVVARRDVPRTPTGRLPRPPSHAVLSVHNTGSVIPPEEVDRVFERFYQLDKARAGQGGRGLGLAIAREIVQSHQGKIEVESSAEHGTTFMLQFPLLESAVRSPLSSTESGRPAEAGVRVSARR
jgi:signal transduction histidine kinase